MAETPLITVRIPDELLDAAQSTGADAGIRAEDRDAGRTIRAALFLMTNLPITRTEMREAFEQAKLAAGWAARKGSTPNNA